MVAKYFSLVVDESKDISKKEQIAIVLRLFNNNHLHECFLEFKAAHGLDAKSLSGVLLDALRRYGLDLLFSVGQGYDGAV